MSKVSFVKMKRSEPNPLDNLTEIDVHPDAVASHVANGWYVAPDPAIAEAATAEAPAEIPEESKNKRRSKSPETPDAE